MSTSLNTQELQEIFLEGARSSLFFSRVIFKELSEEAINSLAQEDYCETSGNELIDQGHHLIRRYFTYKGNDPRTELACEYARIFLASGRNTESRDVATPYESVFTSEDHLVMQESRDEVYRYFLQDGFTVNPSLHEPDDHLAFELEYLSHLSKRAVELVDKDAEVDLAKNVRRQISFVDDHLLSWIPRLREAAKSFAQFTFYIGMLLVIEGFLREYRDLLEEILNQTEEFSLGICA